MAEKDFLVELDMSDFTFEGVNSFVECCYTGSVEGQLNRDTFRDLNKISVVFKVDWIAKECLQLFCDICDNLDEESLDDVRYLFTEAVFLVKERRDKKLVKALNRGLKESPYPELRSVLIRDVMGRDPLEFVDAEVCSYLAGPSTPHMFRMLAESISGKPQPYRLTPVDKHILNPISLAACQDLDKTEYTSLLDTLMASVAPEDHSFLLQLLIDASKASGDENILSEDEDEYSSTSSSSLHKSSSFRPGPKHVLPSKLHKMNKKGRK
eukprot:sb/3468267/